MQLTPTGKRAIMLSLQQGRCEGPPHGAYLFCHHLPHGGDL